MTIELPKKFADTDVLGEKIVRDRVGMLKNIIFKNLLFQQQQDLQNLDAACHSVINRPTLARELILSGIDEFIQQNSSFTRPDVRKILADKRQAEANFELIKPRESIQVMKSLEKFGDIF